MPKSFESLWTDLRDKGSGLMVGFGVHIVESSSSITCELVNVIWFKIMLTNVYLTTYF
jgi:hypothetical protein